MDSNKELFAIHKILLIRRRAGISKKKIKSAGLEKPTNILLGCGCGPQKVMATNADVLRFSQG
jgi:hypothetical protein